MNLSPRDIPAVILAGGEGTRLGRGSKALVRLAEKPLFVHVHDRLKSQTARVALSLRQAEAWADETKLALILDDPKGAGPLAGVAAALAWAKETPCVLTCPTDSPLIPADLGARLSAAMDETTDIVVAASGGRRHHLTALWRTALTIPFDQPMPVHVFQNSVRVRTAEWPVLPFDPFLNINTGDDLTLAEQLCSTF
jgi:molybdopterin-guanine dinucleotide biosynthesis protein A